MTRDQLLQSISELEAAANNMDEPDKTFKLSDIDQLKMELDGMALSDINARMAAISLPDINEMNSNIASAKDANNQHTQRVAAFNSAFQFITGVLKFVI